ncbi:hypothetical protein F383_32218 [Gossypium arboreum]|uniref:Uncharacterized protein n=1 Tax=Gossypium arboreum TaxID=29729 RepID=A0A0B0PGA9_GOSAR|nr:hypothetical protein F383_32218 [Gossypium arboreum]
MVPMPLTYSRSRVGESLNTQCGCQGIPFNYLNFEG